MISAAAIVTISVYVEDGSLAKSIADLVSTAGPVTSCSRYNRFGNLILRFVDDGISAETNVALYQLLPYRLLVDYRVRHLKSGDSQFRIPGYRTRPVACRLRVLNCEGEITPQQCIVIQAVKKERE